MPEDPGACGVNGNYNDGFADNNLESLLHDDMKYETWVAEIFRVPRDITLDGGRGSK